MRDFVYASKPAMIIFGPGKISEVGEWLASLACSRPLVLSGSFQADDAKTLAGRIGAVGTFTKAAMHTPVDVTDEAMSVVIDTKADCVIALGGGSTIGLGKAIAHRTNIPQIVVPTTYAGSEVTPILGQTENGVKTTIKGDDILPEIVIYDPDLTHDLPIPMSVASGLNAMAHAAEALYARDRNPIASMMAVEGLASMKDALPAIVEKPADAEARGKALYGAWLCGAVLGQVGMALHHKICHTLGGSFDMPHAATHAVMLPHTIGFNATAVPKLLKPIDELFGERPGIALHKFADSIGAPMTLAELGLSESDLDKAADIAIRNPYWNPQPIDGESIRKLLFDAFEGNQPTH